MLNKETISDLVKRYIEKVEDLGDKAGGSGHLGFKSYIIDKINEPERVNRDNIELIEVSFQYRIIIETEFTYYPDNPPHEILKKNKIFINNEGKIIEL